MYIYISIISSGYMIYDAYIYNIVSYHIISYHTISYHIISLGFISILIPLLYLVDRVYMIINPNNMIYFISTRYSRILQCLQGLVNVRNGDSAHHRAISHGGENAANRVWNDSKEDWLLIRLSIERMSQVVLYICPVAVVTWNYLPSGYLT